MNRAASSLWTSSFLLSSFLPSSFLSSLPALDSLASLPSSAPWPPSPPWAARRGLLGRLGARLLRVGRGLVGGVAEAGRLRGGVHELDRVEVFDDGGLGLVVGRQQPHDQEEGHHGGHEIRVGDLPRAAVVAVLVAAAVALDDDDLVGVGLVAHAASSPTAFARPRGHRLWSSPAAAPGRGSAVRRPWPGRARPSAPAQAASRVSMRLASAVTTTSAASEAVKRRRAGVDRRPRLEGRAQGVEQVGGARHGDRAAGAGEQEVGHGGAQPVDREARARLGQQRLQRGGGGVAERLARGVDRGAEPGRERCRPPPRPSAPAPPRARPRGGLRLGQRRGMRRPGLGQGRRDAASGGRERLADAVRRGAGRRASSAAVGLGAEQRPHGDGRAPRREGGAGAAAGGRGRRRSRRGSAASRSGYPRR